MALRRLPSFSIFSLNYILYALLLGDVAKQCARNMRFEVKLRLPFHLRVEFEGLVSCSNRLLQHLAMRLPVIQTVGLHHLREPAVSNVIP